MTRILVGLAFALAACSSSAGESDPGPGGTGGTHTVASSGGDSSSGGSVVTGSGGAVAGSGGAGTPAAGGAGGTDGSGGAPAGYGGTNGGSGGSSQGGAGSGGTGGSDEAGSGGSVPECELPLELDCNHDSPSNTPGTLPGKNDTKTYVTGDRITASGHSYECYAATCTTSVISPEYWKPLWWDGCEWRSMCELPAYDPCQPYIGRDAVTFDDSGHTRAYQCNSGAPDGACVEHSPDEGATYLDESVSHPVWVEYAWSFGANGYVCWFF